MKSNLHSHTQFCDGRSTMEDMVRAAQQAGFAVWGFSPHAPVCVESPCNMSNEDVPRYLAEVERLRRLYPDMKLLAGMEVDYIDDTHGPASPEVAGYGLDYVIGSVHFIPNQQGRYVDIDGSPERFRRNLHDVFDDDLAYVVRTFWSQSQRMIEAGGLDIVGHIDKIALNASIIVPDIESDPEYSRLAWQTIDMAIAKGLAIEINTKQYGRYGRFFPHPRYWQYIASHGIDMPVNSDAHEASRVEDGMDTARSLQDMT